MQRTLLGFGVGAVGIALFAFVVMGLFRMDSSPSFPMFSFSRDSLTVPKGPTNDMGPGMMGGMGPGMMGGMGPGMMGGTWTDPGDAAPIEPAFPNADDLTVVLSDFAFDPPVITVQEGQVNITLANEGAAVHDLTVPDLDIRIVVRPGESVTTGLEFDIPGTYDTLCSIPGHVSLGMTGSLIVLPAT